MNTKFRSSGVSLPIFSLPSPYGIGNIGKAARNFIDFLSESGFSYWAILPLGPTAFGDSPYQSLSSRALNHYFIDLEDLVEKDLLKKKDLCSIDWGDNPRQIDYSKIYKSRTKVLKIAYKRFKKGKGDYQRGYTSFLRKHQFTDYACFRVLKEINGECSWENFPEEYRHYSADLFSKLKKEYKDEVEFYEWTQYIFLRQWAVLKDYAEKKDIKIIGIMPMYVSYDSIDVYKNRKNFRLNEDSKMDVVAGYPPDVFFSKGQVWGTPVYDFDQMKKNNYKFLRDRLNFCYSLYDYVYLDHFRGYLETYLIENGKEDGLEGQFEKSEGLALVDSFIQDKSRVLAEDVDYSSSDIRDVLSELGINDTRVLEFGYPREETNFNKANNYPYTCISFSSTHDCKPLKGYLEDMSPQDREKAVREINVSCHHFGVREVDVNDVRGQVESLLELNLASLSNVAIQAMPDLLFQGNESRINTPSTVGINWKYRVTEEDLSPLNAKRLRELNRHYGRCD